MMNLKFWIFALVAAVGMVPLAAQEDRASGMIGSRDSVEIRVFREDELMTRGQLSSAGSITMPLIGVVRLAGMSTQDAAKLIEAKLHDGYLVKPEVTVSISARVRKTVTVLGQAQNPGVFRLDPNRQLTLVEVIGMAGGMTRIANPKKVRLKRRGQEAPYLINLREITSGKAKDIKLIDGDIISIPEGLF